MKLQTIAWVGERPGVLIPGRVRFIDQTRLPAELAFVETSELEDVWRAIRTLQVRGAPAIGIAAAMGVVLAAQAAEAADGAALVAAVDKAAAHLATSRPTAVNLFWALERMKAVAAKLAKRSPADMVEQLAREAMAIRDEDAAMCRAIGEQGARVLGRARTVLTHCNAGGLATAEFGTALAPVYVVHERGEHIHVYVDETRPLLQGARLTAWELLQAGVDATLICDNTAAHVMKTRGVEAVLVGADRIAANGDTANKIGTYGLALLARAHDIPFYVFAPTSTFDLSLSSGAAIPIEERDASEVTRGFGVSTAPANVGVYAPAFDVTPAELITAIVCERGVARPPFATALSRLAKGG